MGNRDDFYALLQELSGTSREVIKIQAGKSELQKKRLRNESNYN